MGDHKLAYDEQITNVIFIFNLKNCSLHIWRIGQTAKKPAKLIYLLNFGPKPNFLANPFIIPWIE
jgi:hypothetical protein